MSPSWYRTREALFGSEAIKARRFPGVLRDTVAVAVHRAEVVLSLRKALSGAIAIAIAIVIAIAIAIAIAAALTSPCQA